MRIQEWKETSLKQCKGIIGAMEMFVYIQTYYSEF